MNFNSRQTYNNIIFAYQGEVNEALLDAVYAMMDNHLEQKKTASEFKKRFYHLLVESLQNVFHHQTPVSLQLNKFSSFNPVFGNSLIIVTFPVIAIIFKYCVILDSR